MRSNYYVYSHINPSNGKCFYIGVGTKDRIIDGGQHRNKDWKKLVYQNNGFLFKVLVNNITKQSALKIEKSFIKQIGLDNLTNMVGESGNSTAFKKGQIPWNKGLKSNQSCAYKEVIYNGIKYDSVKELRQYLNIGNTTLYRRLKKGILKIEYVCKNLGRK